MEKFIALTFDDGPNTITTPRVLEKLQKYGIVATFFVIGNEINDDSERVMKKAVSMGCEIENHSKSHPAFPELSKEEMQSEVTFTDEKVTKAVNRTPEFFRPPYIAYNEDVYDAVDKTFICGVGADDWDDNVPTQKRIDVICSSVSAGSVILLHDMKGNDKTVEAIDVIIPTLKAEGYTFVTVSGLFEKYGITPKPHTIYTNVLND